MDTFEMKGMPLYPPGREPVLSVPQPEPKPEKPRQSKCVIEIRDRQLVDRLDELVKKSWIELHRRTTRTGIVCELCWEALKNRKQL